MTTGAMERYRDWWDIYDELPDGWEIDQKNDSPMARTVFIVKGKSPLTGQKRALLRIKK